LVNQRKRRRDGMFTARTENIKIRLENIMQAQTDILRIPKNEAYEKGIDLLRRVGLAEKANNYPDEEEPNTVMIQI